MPSSSRRQFLAQWTALAAAAPARLPNFVILLADDLGYGDLGCFGSQTLRTPNLDRMAGEGMRFTNFYAAAPFCSPTRASLLTGRYPVRAGVPNVLFPTERTGLPQSELTIAKLLKPLGYATACIGKWHLGNLPEFRAHRHGFDFFYGLPYANDSRKQLEGEPFRPVLAREELPLMENDDVVEAPVNQHTLTTRYTERAMQFLRQNNSKPFLLYLPYTAPHTPLYAATAREGISKAGIYGDSVEEIDWSVGRVFDTLRELQLDRNTLVFFTSDNGPRASGPGPRDGGGSTGGLRGRKGTTWEGGMRVPAILWWPGKIAAGVESAAVASTNDLFPTIAHFAGVKLPRGRVIDGRPLHPAPAKDALFCYYFGAQLQAVRMGRWKLLLEIKEYPPRPLSIWYADQRIFHQHYRLMPKAQLYDLHNDPGEKADVAESHPAIVRKLTQMARRATIIL